MTADDTTLIQNLRDDIIRLTGVLEKFREASQDSCDRRMDASALQVRADYLQTEERLVNLERWRYIITGAVIGVGGVAGIGGIAKGLTFLSEIGKAIL